jgi:hypothetical protein
MGCRRAWATNGEIFTVGAPKAAGHQWRLRFELGLSDIAWQRVTGGWFEKILTVKVSGDTLFRCSVGLRSKEFTRGGEAAELVVPQ